MKTRLRALVLAFLLTATQPLVAKALPQIDFGIFPPTTGSISYAGGANPLLGTNIGVDIVVGLGTALNNHVVRSCISCVLNFTTGNLASSSATSWTFGAGGSIVITGGVDLDNDGDANDPGDVPVGTSLLAGTFTGNPVVLAFGNAFRVVGAGFVDVKNSVLAAFYGLEGGPDVGYVGGLNLSFGTSAIPPNGFSSSELFSGDVINQPESGGQQVPLPSSLLLMVSGLALIWRRGKTR